jgi:G3E family GTPase
MRPVPTVMFIGGFLGAGKTAAIKALNEMLSRQERRVAAVTNDQARGLVDTDFLAASGLATREVTGSCFCCNFPALEEAVLESVQNVRPEILFAEPVGSCTDIVATVIRPMQERLAERARVAAFSVLLDPMRWTEIMETGGDDLDSMRFLLDKQLQEADIIVLTKQDLLTEGELEAVASQVGRSYPGKPLFRICSRNNAGLDQWLEAALQTPAGTTLLNDIDYGVYARAEAEMGWLNASYSVQFGSEVDGNDFASRLVEAMRLGIGARKGRIGNLKVLARSGDEQVKSGIVSPAGKVIVEKGFSFHPGEIDLNINLRATLSPGMLNDTVQEALSMAAKSFNAAVELNTLNTFRPSPPCPTHRYLDKQ